MSNAEYINLEYYDYECCVCYENYFNTDAKLNLNCCKIIICDACFLLCLLQKHACPLCRTNLDIYERFPDSKDLIKKYNSFNYKIRAMYFNRVKFLISSYYFYTINISWFGKIYNKNQNCFLIITDIIFNYNNEE